MRSTGTLPHFDDTNSAVTSVVVAGMVCHFDWQASAAVLEAFRWWRGRFDGTAAGRLTKTDKQRLRHAGLNVSLLSESHRLKNSHYSRTGINRTSQGSNEPDSAFRTVPDFFSDDARLQRRTVYCGDRSHRFGPAEHRPELIDKDNGLN